MTGLNMNDFCSVEQDDFGGWDVVLWSLDGSKVILNHFYSEHPAAMMVAGIQGITKEWFEGIKTFEAAR